MKTEELIRAYMKAHSGLESEVEQKALEAKVKLLIPVKRKGK